MKNLDLISKRILVISLSISSVLLSAGLLIFAARPAIAQTTPQISSRMDDGRRYDAVAAGTAGSVLIWNTQTGTFKRLSLTGNSLNSSNESYISLSVEKFW